MEPLDDVDEFLRHPSSKFASCERYRNAIKKSYSAKYFQEGHFLLYELGFNPLTLILANYEDFKQACGHYIAMSSLIEFSLSRLEGVLNEESYNTLFQCLRHRKMMIAGLDLIRQRDYDFLRKQQEYEDFLEGQLIFVKVHLYNVGKILATEHEALKKAT